MASQELINEIINNTDTVALVSKYVNLEKKGKNYVGLCPFHNEKTPSFNVSPEKHLARCFGCGTGGTIIDFIMAIERLDFPHALKYIADFNGMDVDLNVKSNDTKYQQNKKYYEIMNVAVSYYEKVLFNTKEGENALNYLLNRGISLETIKKLHIGLSPERGNNLYKVLIESGYLELDIKDLGLVNKNDYGYYDFFTERIMFPIFDEKSNPIAFSARIYKPEQKDESKYMNSGDTILFKKSEELFNLNNAIDSIRIKKRAILHEGQMDVVASFESGLEEAFCSLGTSLNKQAVLKIKKYTTNIIICYDGDKAGINASLKAIDLFLFNGFNVKLVLLPNKMDPDEFKKKYSKEKYFEYFNNHIIEYYEYQYQVAFIDKDLSSIEEKEKIKNNVFGILFRLKSNTLQETYLNKLSKDLQYDLVSLKQDFRNYFSNETTKNYKIVDNYEENFPPIVTNDVVVEEKDDALYYSICELRLFIYARSEKQKALYIDKEIIRFLSYGFSKSTMMLWIKLINDYYQNFDFFEETTFINMLSSNELADYINLLKAVGKDKTPYNDIDLRECILKIEEVSYQNEIKDIAKIIGNEVDETKKLNYLNRQFELKRELQRINKNRKKGRM